MTADETWGHYYEPETKRQSMEYHHKDSPSKKKSRTQASVVKLLASVFLVEAIHVDFPEPEITINPEQYIPGHKTLEQLTRIQRKKENVLLQHDSTRPQTSTVIMEVTERLNLTLRSHPPYSSDLAP